MPYQCHILRLICFQRVETSIPRNSELNIKQKRNLKRVFDRSTITNRATSEKIKFQQASSQILSLTGSENLLNSSASTSDGRMPRKSMARVRVSFRLNNSLNVQMDLMILLTGGQMMILSQDFLSLYTNFRGIGQFTVHVMMTSAGCLVNRREVCMMKTKMDALH